VLPETETKTVVRGSTAKINNESHDQKTNNCDDLDTGKDKFGFTINGDGEDIEADDEDNNYGDPCCNTDIGCTVPVSDNNRGGRNFGTESDGRSIPVLLKSELAKLRAMEKNLRSIQRRIREHHRRIVHKIEE